MGKTLSAESIAEHLKRPLLSVSSGSLGDSAADLERKLAETLELARTWRAVVLIDEADVFLEVRLRAADATDAQSRRDMDIARNSLVAVFLRALERHCGVLILTTNRIKSFDEAFLSRISCGASPDRHYR